MGRGLFVGHAVVDAWETSVSTLPEIDPFLSTLPIEPPSVGGTPFFQQRRPSRQNCTKKRQRPGGL